MLFTCHKTLIDTNTQLQINIVRTHHYTYGLTTLNTLSSDPFSFILLGFPELLQPHNFKTPVRHDVVHHIETTGSPVFART